MRNKFSVIALVVISFVWVAGMAFGSGSAPSDEPSCCRQMESQACPHSDGKCGCAEGKCAGRGEDGKCNCQTGADGKCGCAEGKCAGRGEDGKCNRGAEGKCGCQAGRSASGCPRQ